MEVVSGTSEITIYLQDAQLEQGLVARDYIETTTTAVEGGITDNVPRLDYTDSSCPALLLEPQRTNLFAFADTSNMLRDLGQVKQVPLLLAMQIEKVQMEYLYSDNGSGNQAQLMDNQ